MRLNYILPFIFIASVLPSCSDRNDDIFVPDPVYSEIIGVNDITSNSATFTLRVKVPVDKVASGEFHLDDRYFFSYGFFYTVNPDQGKRYWQFAEALVSDESGTYTLTVSDLSASSKYYVKGWVLASKEKMQQTSFNESENTIEFETPQ